MEPNAENDSGDVKRRQRLAPQERVPLILDAALDEFSRRGYVATRMDDIARRSGLSKGGLYAHFDGKDAILKALLSRAMHPVDWGEMPRMAMGDARAVAEWLVDRLHETLLAPDSVAILRILIPERERVPARVDEWRQSLTRLRTEQVAQLIRSCLSACGKPQSVLARHPWLALSPVIHVLLWQTIFGDGTSPDPGYREAHVAMLCELLGGRQPMPPSVRGVRGETGLALHATK